MTQRTFLGAGAPPAKPAWRPALGWVVWLGLAYAGMIILGRCLVTYRLGGTFLTPYFAVLLGSALLTAGALWPLLAHAAKDPVRAYFIQFGVQWGTIGLLALGLGTAVGAVWEDANLEALANFVARDVIVAEARASHIEGARH